MSFANAGNLEEFLQPHGLSDEEGGGGKETRKEQVRQRRQRRKSMTLGEFTEASSTRREEEDEDTAKRKGGIGMGRHGRPVRYLKTYQIWKFFLDICSGLAHLHHLGIIHRDLVCTLPIFFIIKKNCIY
jgi:hypothetical protein